MKKSLCDSSEQLLHQCIGGCEILMNGNEVFFLTQGK